jgi:menaquinone-dependent protoporphyrinogen oxidase
MRILVTYGSTRGGTRGLAEMVADDLRADGFDVDLLPPRQVRRLDGYDAVVVGGALYASRWHRESRRFVKRHAAEIRQRPAYFFSSGPLDDSAGRGGIPPVKGVEALMEKAGVREHITFGGRLRPDAKGFPASAMAKKRAGDWRDAGHVKQWTQTIASQLRGEVRQDA